MSMKSDAFREDQILGAPADEDKPRRMTDAELIAECDAKARVIMRDQSHVGDPNARASQIEVAVKYQVCAAILAGEITYPELCRLIRWNEEAKKAGGL